MLAKLDPEITHDIAVQSGNPYMLSSVSRGLRRDLGVMKPPQAVVIEADKGVDEIRTMLRKLNEQYTIFSVHLKSEHVAGRWSRSWNERLLVVFGMCTPHLTHLKLSGSGMEPFVGASLIEYLHQGHLVSLELDRMPDRFYRRVLYEIGDGMSKCPSLRQFSITNSSLGAVKDLGLHRCKTLTHLTLHHDQLSSVEFRDNRFSDDLIDLLSLPNLVELDLSSNHLERLFYDPSCWGPGSLSRMREAVEKSGLRRLDLRQNESSITTPLAFQTFGKLVDKGVEVLLDEA